jgi:membrane protein implicated in regulation of membrane protease activity
MFAVNDALDVIFLGCFFFGLLFTAGALVLGVADIGGDAEADADGELGPLNVSTVLAFVAWFGGVGYLARNGLGAFAVISLVLAIAGGAAGAYLVWWLLRTLKRSEQYLDPKDYELPGTLAKVTSGIRVDGVGEIVYEQAGVRQVSAARSLDGRAIARGTEVLVLRTAGGIAFVQPFEEALADARAPDRERDPNRLSLT